MTSNVSGDTTGTVTGDDELRVALDEMAAATDRLLATVDQLPEGALREPSLLPGWTRGHGLTHIARNADAMVNLGHAARTGDGRPMYPGGREGRDADIEAGSGRELGDQRLDIAESAERLLGEFAGDFPTEARDRQVEMRAGAMVFGWELPWLRTREVEIHHVDLDAGYTPADWSAEFAARTLGQVAAVFRTGRDCPVGSLVATDTDGRWEVAADGPELAGPMRDLLAWLVGRSQDAGRRALRLDPPGEVPVAPSWA